MREHNKGGQSIVKDDAEKNEARLIRKSVCRNPEASTAYVTTILFSIAAVKPKF
jgi:hypothetical protein